MTIMTTLSDDERLYSAIVHHIASASSSVSDVRTLRDLPDKLLYLRATLFLTNGLRNISYRGHWTRRITGSTSRRPVQSSSVCALWTCCVFNLPSLRRSLTAERCERAMCVQPSIAPSIADCGTLATCSSGWWPWSLSALRPSQTAPSVASIVVWTTCPRLSKGCGCAYVPWGCQAAPSIAVGSSVDNLPKVVKRHRVALLVVQQSVARVGPLQHDDNLHPLQSRHASNSQLKWTFRVTDVY